MAQEEQQAVTSEGSPDEKRPEAGQAPAEKEPHIPKPPSREDLERISREQALITDEWTGEGPEEAPPAGR